MPSGGEREIIGAVLMVVGFLFWLGGGGYLSLWFMFLNETWAERIGNGLMGSGVVLIVSGLA